MGWEEGVVGTLEYENLDAETSYLSKEKQSEKMTGV